MSSSKFCCSSKTWSENERKQNYKKKYLDLASELKKLWKIKVTVIPFVVSALGRIPKCLKKNTGGIGNQRKYQDHPDHSIEKTSVKTHLLELVLKIHNE